MDRISRSARSKNMAAVKAKGNKSTEYVLARLLRASKLSGWRRHPSAILGKPDFIFRNERVAVFADGCFWHGCRLHSTIPKTRSDFWRNKIRTNKNRDRKVGQVLRRNGWRVIRVWEHQIKRDPSGAIALITGTLREKK